MSHRRQYHQKGGDSDTRRTARECLTRLQIDLETLQPYGVTRQTSLHPDLKGPLSSAHAEYDAVTGDFYNFNLEFGRYATYRVFHTSLSTGETEILATITGPQIKPAYIHSFFLTEDYVILCIWPALFGAGGAQILWKRSLVDAIGFHPELQSRWCVVDRRQGRGLVATFLSPAFFSFHTVNSWQEEGADGSTDIFCDIVQLPNSDILQVLQYDNLLSTGPGAGNHGGSWGTTLQRYRLASIPKTGKMDAATDADLPRAETVVSIDNEAVGDLPTFNPRFHTKKSRYVYNVTNRGLVSTSVSPASSSLTLDSPPSRTACPRLTPIPKISRYGAWRSTHRGRPFSSRMHTTSRKTPGSS